MNSKRPTVESLSQRTLFDLQRVSEPASRPFSLPNIFLGTSSFTASGWEGSFYPLGMRSKDFLRHYASQFQTVEIDSTFYGTPSASTVTSWNEKTPSDFIIAAKVPQVVTHEKVLVDCDAEFEEFVKTMDILGPKLGPMVFQFPLFDRWKFPKQESFLAALAPFLKKLPTDHKFVIEIRNKTWLDARFAEVLREHNVALALTDTSFMPRPWELKQKFDLVTADFAYVRWLGDRKGIEKQTTTWDKIIVDRTNDLKNWVDILKEMVNDKKIRKMFAFCQQSLPRLWACNHETLFGFVEQGLMITRNEVKMVVLAVVGTAFILAGLFARTVNVGGSKPTTVKWYHRLIAIFVVIYSIIIAIQLYGER